jgi:hypothetical protein
MKFRSVLVFATTFMLLAVHSLAQAERPSRAVPWHDGPAMVGPSDAFVDEGGLRAFGPGLQAGADHIIGFQCSNGGWGWPHEACPTTTYNNITGPIALGLLHAYGYTGDAAHLASAVAGGDYDLTFTYPNTEFRFGVFAPAFLHTLSGASGDGAYSSHAAVYFFDELTAKTYGTADLDTHTFIAAVQSGRIGGLINLRPWDFHMLPFAAGAIGNADSTTPLDGISQQTAFLGAMLDGLNTLDKGNISFGDLIGLAGGVRGLALNNTAAFAAIVSPLHADINGIATTCDLADVLAGLQNADGSWNWSSGLAAPDETDKDTQTTAYAVMALAEAALDGCGPYATEIDSGRAWLQGMQLANGGFRSYPGGGSNIEVEAEALNALVPDGCTDDVLEFLLAPGSDCVQPGQTVVIELHQRGLTQLVRGFQAFAQYDSAALTHVSNVFTAVPYGLELLNAVNAGDIDLAAGINDLGGQLPTMADAHLVTLSFTAGAIDGPTYLSFRAHNPPSRFSDTLGNEVTPCLVESPAIIVDGTDPVVTCPADTTIECDESSAPANTGSATATDNLDAAPVITFGDVETPGACPQEKTITRTWTATDCAGNTHSCNQIITVEDTTDPVITCPGDVTIECSDSSAPANTGSASAIDNCDGAPIITFSDSDVIGGCPQEKTITRTWTATDACGNDTSCDQTITVQDTTAPTFTCPEDVTIECDESTLPDNTGYAGFFQGFELNRDGWFDFGGTLTRVASGTNGVTSADGSWHAETNGAFTRWGGYSSVFPAGGYTTSIDMYLNVDAGFGNDTRFDYSSAINTPGGAHRRDFIFNGGFYNDAPDYGSGNRYVFSASNNAEAWPKNPARDPFPIMASGWYTFEHRFYDSGGGVLAVDLVILDSGGSELHSWTLSDVTDIIGSTVGGNRYGWLIGLDWTLPIDNTAMSGFGNASDNCDTTPTVAYSDVVTPGGCPEEKSIARTWTATDDCGNQTSCVQTITVVDTTDPVFACPDDVTIECDDSIDPLASAALLPDGWSTDYQAAVAATGDGSNPSAVRLRSVSGDVPPYGAAVWEPSAPLTFADLATLSADYMMTIGCFAGGAPRFAVGLDNNSDDIVDGHVTVYWGTLPNYTDCPTLSVWHNTGNLITAGDNRFDLTQFAGPFYGSHAQALATAGTYDVEYIIIALDGSWSQDQEMWIDHIAINATTYAFGAPSATDNCDDAPVVSFSDDADLIGCNGTGTIDRTWTATDGCSNSTSCVQTITVVDTTDPVITCPSDTTIECDESTDPSNTGEATAIDNCDGAPLLTYGDVNDLDDCDGTGTITRTWTAEDGCGNDSMCVQTITVVDTTAPVITCPADTTVECDESTLPANTGEASAIDNCDGTPSIASFSSSQQWVLSSPAGWSFYTTNTASGALVSGPGSPPAGTGSFHMPTGSGVGPGLGGKTFLGTRDHSGTLLSDITTLSYSTYVAPGSPTVNLAVAINMYVDLDGNGTRDTTMVFEPIYVPGQGAITHGTWQTWDTLSGNGWWYTANFGALTNNFNEFKSLAYYISLFPNAQIVDWGLTPGFQFVSGSSGGTPWVDFDGNVDNLTFNATNHDFEAGDIDCYPRLIERLWLATDDCGNASACIQEITVADTTPPVITCPSDITVPADAGGCDAVVEYAEQFDNAVCTSATQTPNCWYVDRYAPSAFVNDVLSGENVLRHTISSADSAGTRPGSFSSTFYNTHGRKFDVDMPVSATIRVDLYIPASWATDARRADLWATLFDSVGDVSGYPIVGFIANDPADPFNPDPIPANVVPRFRAWMDEGLGGWNEMGLPTGFVYDAWYTLQVDISPTQYEYKVIGPGGDLTFVYGTTEEHITVANVMLQAYTFSVTPTFPVGDTYDVYWDNVGLPPVASDNCDGSPAIVCDYPSGSTFPEGTTEVTCTATDCSGNASQCTFDVTVEGTSEMVVSVELSPTMVAGPLTRCITFDLWECPDTGPVATVEAEMSFVNGLASGTIDVPCGSYSCITARDTLHTLRRTDEAFTISGTQYVADFTGNPSGGGDWLIGGNLNDDFWIDILDFGVYSFQFAMNYGTGDTDCNSVAPNADIQGNGIVFTEDFTFIQVNFLKGHEANCCGAPLRGGPQEGDEGPVVSITVEELLARGLGHLAAADLNEDGVLDQADMVAFAQGARPQVQPGDTLSPSEPSGKTHRMPSRRLHRNGQ